MERLAKRFPRYSRFLYLYPSGYRKEYGEQMLQTLADMLDDPERHRISVWAQLGLDFPFSVIKQQLTYTGEVMATDTPLFMKRSALVGTGLLLPFFVLLTLNGLMHNRLQHSWVWNSWFLFLWIIFLPICAVTVNVLALHRKDRLRSVLRPSAWRSNWPALIVLLLGLGILALVFFHDSVHCVAGNPIRELHNPHQTWQCIQRG